MDIESDELVKIFVTESFENLAVIEKTLLEAEGSASLEAVEEIFRAMHSVKGGAGFCELKNMEQVSHKAETLLDAIRNGETQMNTGIVDILLKVVDTLSEMLGRSDFGDCDDMSLLLAEIESAVKTGNDPSLEPHAEIFFQEEEPSCTSTGIQRHSLPIEIDLDEPTPDLVGNCVNPVVNARKVEQTAIEQDTIRIGVKVLDELLELIGEVVLGRNQFFEKYEKDQTFQSVSQSITKLHQHVIQTRMQPIGVLFNKYKRTVRDLSKELGKKIELHIEGSELELDRKLLEAFSDPLSHLVRNAIDHGIENPNHRSDMGKPVLGNLYLKAHHESGQILIEVEDDGKGLDPETIRKKAIEKGLIETAESEQLSDKDIIQLVFHPGFSTKDQATKLSGRGVGMDVVRNNLEKIGCKIELFSTSGKGTIIQTRIPLTQAIVNSSVISGLVIKLGEYTLAIPQVAVNEVIKLSPENEMTRISNLNGQEVFKLRDKLIPLVHLEDILDIPRTYMSMDGQIREDRRLSFVDRRAANSDEEESVYSDQRQGDDRRYNNLIFMVLQFKQNYFGVLVDQIIGKEEIVVKRLPQIIKHRKVFAGSTILGNGKISLILDINGMVEKAELNFGRQQDTLFNTIMSRKIVAEDTQRLVIFNYAPTEYFAVPVNLLSEVDKFKVKDIKKVGTREFIQLHGKSIPLLRLDQSLNVSPLKEERDELIVIVPSRVKYPTGIVGNRIIEHIELTENLNTKEADECGIMGTFFHNDDLISLIDIFSLLQSFDPKRYRNNLTPVIANCRILFAEDQIFFRQLISQYFKSCGIVNITVCKNGEDAFNTLINNPNGFDIVITDIEMPVMNGYELVSNIKADPRIKDIPVMALTTLDSEEHIKKGIEAGFDAYEIKLDKDRVINRVSTLYNNKNTNDKD